MSDNVTQALVPQLVMIDDFLIDVSLREEHNFESEVTEYPIEKGADITDNIRPKPLQVTMEGLVSNTPVNPFIVSARTSVDQSVDEAYAKLQKIRDAREPVTIRTSLQTYKNMAMKNLVIPRQPGQADALQFTASFIQVDIVENTRTTRVATPIAIKSKTMTKPASTTTFPDRVKVVGVSPRADVIGKYAAETMLWYDDDIGGWREPAFWQYDHAIVIVAKGKPFGASYNDWTLFKTDAYWKFVIAQSSQQLEGTTPGNPYDPFDTINVNIVHDIVLVHAYLWSRTPGDLPLSGPPGT